MLEQQILKDYIQAMKDKDSLKSSVLSFLRAQLKNVIIEKKVDELEDQEVIAVIKKQVKQRQDSISQFEQGNRQDLVEKEKKELEILRLYLPEEMPEEETKKIIDQVVQELGASSMKDMGAVMKAVGLKTQGRADNKLVSNLVRQSLS
ncbi:MAG: GatB/YqeY domain-containing protein [Candidatus Aceula lacicola]|nr:GatB/YqeY domain-containing protein [Candidatus Aceula lacicola]